MRTTTRYSRCVMECKMTLVERLAAFVIACAVVPLVWAALLMVGLSLVLFPIVVLIRPEALKIK